MTFDKESITAKIQKLLNLKEGAKTEAEALNAATRIAEITKKYNLDIGSIELEREETTATEAEVTFEGNQKNHLTFIANACDALFGVSHYHSTIKRNTYRKQINKIVFFGLKASVSSALLTFNYLVASCDAMFASYKKSYGSTYGDAQSFRIGFGQGIHSKAVEYIRSKNQYAPASQEENAIVLIGKNLIEKHAIKLGMRIHHVQPKFNKYSGAYSDGFKAGKDTDLFDNSRLLS